MEVILDLHVCLVRKVEVGLKKHYSYDLYGEKSYLHHYYEKKPGLNFFLLLILQNLNLMYVEFDEN
jgi:hypothetical protein